MTIKSIWNWLSDNLAIVISILGLILNVVVHIVNYFIQYSARKRLTIDQFHEIASEDGPICWLYHMTAAEQKSMLKLISSEHDYLREKSDHTFIMFEDNMGKLDEFASALYHKLYDYKTFECLAFNFCRKRVVPNLVAFLECYKDYENYKSIRWLTYKMYIKSLKMNKKKLEAESKELKMDITKHKNEIDKCEKYIKVYEKNLKKVKKIIKR